MPKKSKEQKRAEYEEKRKKKFTKLKNKGQMENYYDSKKGRKKKANVSKEEAVAKTATTEKPIKKVKNKSMLAGYKTYIMAVMALVSVVMGFLGWIDFETLVKLVTIFIAGEGAALRSALKKTQIKG